MILLTRHIDSSRQQIRRRRPAGGRCYRASVVGAVLLKKHTAFVRRRFSSEFLLAFTQEDLAIVGVIVLLRLALFS